MQCIYFDLQSIKLVTYIKYSLLNVYILILSQDRSPVKILKFLSISFSERFKDDESTAYASKFTRFVQIISLTFSFDLL